MIQDLFLFIDLYSNTSTSTLPWKIIFIVKVFSIRLYLLKEFILLLLLMIYLLSNCPRSNKLFITLVDSILLGVWSVFKVQLLRLLATYSSFFQ